MIVYDGPSMIDGKPIVVALTGVKRKSANPKTGDMVQAWIIRKDIHPVEAVEKGEDRAICGDCPARGTYCYVNVGQAPAAVFKALGKYERLSVEDAAVKLTGRKVRLGAYGDPAAVPIGVWDRLLKFAAGHTGYTHQWREFPEFKRLVMASVEGDTVAPGWRTFRVLREGESDRANEIRCPAESKRRTCETCMACNGGSDTKRSVTIMVHGAKAGRINLL